MPSKISLIHKYTTAITKSFLVIAVVLYTSFGQTTEKLVIGVSANAPPKAAVKAILQYAYDSIGVRIEFQEFPDKRSIMLANEGFTDAEAFRVKGIANKYPNLVRIDVPLRIDNMYLYVKEGKEFQLDGWSSIPKDYVVGYRRGVLFAEYAVREHQLKYNELESTDKIGRHLYLERSDTVLLGAVGRSIFDELGELNIVRLEPPIHITILYHYVHKRNAYLVPALTATLKEMHVNGQLKVSN